MIQTKRNFVFDFDSTLTSVEALDVLAEISLVNNSKKDEIINEIVDITIKCKKIGSSNSYQSVTKEGFYFYREK